MRAVGPPFIPWLHEVIRDDEVAVISLKEFWPQIVGDLLAGSTALLRLRNRTLEMGVSGRQWEWVLLGMARTLMSKVNGFWSQPLARRLDFRVVDPWPEDRSA